MPIFKVTYSESFTLRLGCPETQCGRQLGKRRKNQQENGENYVMKRYMICIPQQRSYGYQGVDEKDM